MLEGETLFYTVSGRKQMAKSPDSQVGWYEALNVCFPHISMLKSDLHVIGSAVAFGRRLVMWAELS